MRSHAAACGSAGGDRLDGRIRARALLAKPPSSSARLLVLAGGGDHRVQRQRAVGERAGLVEAHGVDVRERLDRVQVLHQQPWRVSRIAAAAKVMLVSRISPSGTSVTMPAVATPAASRNGRCVADQHVHECRAERDHHADQHLQELVDLQLERRALGAVLAGGARDLGGVALAAGVLGDERPPPSTAERSRQHPLADARSTATDSPVSGDSSSISPADSTTVPSATIWSPDRRLMRSPSTTWSTGTSRSVPSRITRARGATSSAAASRVRLARISWMMPSPELATTMNANSPSARAARGQRPRRRTRAGSG